VTNSGKKVYFTIVWEQKIQNTKKNITNT